MTDKTLIDSRPPLGSVVAVNAKLLSAVLLSFASYWCWPTNPQWWGFGFISICLGGAAFGQTIAALRLMAQLRARRTAINTLHRSGAQPKSATLADTDLLRAKGVIDE